MTTNEMTDFKEQLRAALQRNAQPEPLIELTRRYYASGGSPSEAYESMQELWLEHGFDEDNHADPNPKRDALEFVLERIWYWCE
jgi:hypothetical protein